MLAESLLYDNEILFYIHHFLYKLEKIKIAFENHYPIDTKLFRKTFNHTKFHAMTYFDKYIYVHGNAINYDIVYSEIAYKYLINAFYKQTNKKEYKSLIL